MIVAFVLFLVIIGSIAFHFWTPWWWTEVASNWGNIDDTIILTFWVTGAVFVAVFPNTISNKKANSYKHSASYPKG